MSNPDDHNYYWIRAAEEFERGGQAVDSIVAAVHYELAFRYGTLAAQTGTRAPKLKLVKGTRDVPRPDDIYGSAEGRHKAVSR